MPKLVLFAPVMSCRAVSRSGRAFARAFYPSQSRSRSITDILKIGVYMDVMSLPWIDHDSSNSKQ